MMSDKAVIQISPQEMVISNRNILISTLLGSCVAICLHDGKGTGAICHAMLPRLAVKGSGMPGVKERLKFVDSALELMLERFADRGITPKHLNARLYGGANMFDVEKKGMMDVGSKNIETARLLLERCGIPVRAMDVGGNQGRKISFNPCSGELTLYLVPADTRLSSDEVKP